MKCKVRKRVCIYLICSVAICIICGCSRPGKHKITHTDTAMGTIIQQTLYVEAGNSKAGRQQNAEEELPLAVMERLEQLEKNTLSWRIEGSEVYGINHRAEKEKGMRLSDELAYYLSVIDDVWEKSEGALDITIGQLTRLWDLDAYAGDREASAKFSVPEQAKILETMEHAGYEKVKIEGGKIFLKDAVQLDMGAVGKGIACDEVKKLLIQRQEVTGAVISIGGSILVFGEKPDGSPWKIGIQHPREPEQSIAILKIPTNMVVSTSGDYERYVEKDGKRYHHIMDPATGYPADSGVISVTVVSESGILSDALSTACYVLGKEKGIELAEIFGVEAYIVDREMKVAMTEGMEKYIER